MKRFPSHASLALALVASLACGDDATPVDTLDTASETTNDTADTADLGDLGEETAPVSDAGPEAGLDDGTADSADSASETVTPSCQATEPLCSDEQIAQLAFSDQASGGPITEEGTAEGVFISHVDATAGGFNGSLGYTYARFTDAGLVAVELSDEASLDAMDWDIAARRFVLRLNSGVSGPSCVTGGRTAPGTTFEGLTEVPPAVTLREEQYFTADGCEYVSDTSGIGSPQTVLASFWSYGGCVAMTDNVYLVALANGRHVKLQILSYYAPAVQETCNKTDAAPTPNGAGNIRIKWAFLD